MVGLHLIPSARNVVMDSEKEYSCRGQGQEDSQGTSQTETLMNGYIGCSSSPFFSTKHKILFGFFPNILSSKTRRRDSLHQQGRERLQGEIGDS